MRNIANRKRVHPLPRGTRSDICELGRKIFYRCFGRIRSISILPFVIARDCLALARYQREKIAL